MWNERIRLSAEELELLNEVLVERFGLCFPESKREILEARLLPRLRELLMQRFMDYYLFLQVDFESERRHLIRQVTNNETYFFREEAQFEGLFSGGLKELKVGGRMPEHLRFLSAGCSSGEEPYTLNIHLKERRFRLGGFSATIDAFDLDNERLEQARQGRYSHRSLRALEEERVERYFQRRGEEQYILKRPFREGVSFRFGNIVDAVSFGPPRAYDVILCRNVLIYFAEPALHKAVENFARALRPGGLLFLGHSESIIGLSPKFETLRMGQCIVYRRV